MSKSPIIWIILLCALISTGCSSFIKAEQPAVLDYVILDEVHSVGQTFVAHFNGMNGVDIYLEPVEGANGEIQLILREAPQSENLGRASLSTIDISAPGYYHFHLPIQTDSNQQNYYLLLKVKGSSSFKVGTAPGNTYLNGALYQNNQPNDQHQTAFQLSYYLPRVGLGLMGELMTWVWYLLAAGFLFVIPGWAMLDWAFGKGSRGAGERGSGGAGDRGVGGGCFTPGSNLPDTYCPNLAMHNWATKLTISIGISLSFYTVLFSFTDAINLQLGSFYAWVPPIVGAVVILWQNRKNLKPLNLLKPKFSWVDFTFLAIILIIFASRFWIIRSVPIPLWGDSQQHAMITQLMLDNDGLFSSWQPYTPYYSLTTHFGFSAFFALLAWVTGMNGTQATLWMGQILNGLAILAIYPLAVKISRGNRWAGIGALIISGLVFTTPAFYVNWGRYAQLAGQVILPIALWLLWDCIDRDQYSLRSEWPRLLLAGMAVTGMTLSYYRMPFYFATFVPILLVFWGLPKWRFNAKSWGDAIMQISIIGLFCIVLFIPWGMRLTGSNLANAVEAGVAKSAPTSLIMAEFKIIKDTTNYIPKISLLISGIALIWALIRKNWLAAALPLWFILLLGYRAGAIIKLPGANMLQVFAILIAIYIPLGLVLGWCLGEIMSFISKANSKWPLAIASLLVLIIASWFGWQQRLILNQHQYALVTPPDLKAFSWIETQTPADAQFLVQGFVYRCTAAGADAGWWLPLLTGRGNMIPPQYAQFNEASQPPDYTQRVVELVTTLENHPINEPESIAALCNWGITHIYHGQGQGEVGGPPLYDPAELEAAPAIFTQVYHQDRVSIFTLNPAACDQQP